LRYDLKQPLEGGTEAVACRIRFGAGTVALDGKAPAGVLASGSLEYEDDQPRHSVRAGDRETLFEVAAADRPWRFKRSGVDWDLHLSPVPVYNALRFDLGACKCRLDLSDLKIRELELRTGASTITIDMGDHGLVTKVFIEAGAASVRLRVPRSVGVRAETSGAFASTNLEGGGFVLGRRTWTSRDYETQSTRLDLELRAGATSFNLDWVD